MFQMKIATYRTRAGAERYAADLRKAFPERQFRVTPWEFGFGVVIMVVACPRAKIASWIEIEE
jgi:hypothetical protein